MFFFMWSTFLGLMYYAAGLLTAVVIYLIFFTAKSTLEEDGHKHKREINQAKLSDYLFERLQTGEAYKTKEMCESLTYLLQFIFQEKQHEKELRRWLTELLSQEFSELISHKALSKVLKKMEIQELNLGDELPAIESIQLMDVELMKDTRRINKVEVSLDIKYKGGFQLAIDATTKLSKIAVVKIKVLKLVGRACFEVTRIPFTHWKFSFYEEPEILLKVEASVLGRTVPHIESIIENQLYSAVKKRHTLPNFKVRGSPLVKRKSTLYSSVNEEKCEPKGILFPASLFATLVNCSRLQSSLVGASIYFSLTLSEVPLICAYETPVGIWLTRDIVIVKSSSSSIGILLRTADDNSQIIETVNSKSDAHQAGLRKNDIILAVNNVPLLSGAQANKIFGGPAFIKSSNGSQELTLRIKRLIFTDHKKTSIDLKAPFDSLVSPDEGGTTNKSNVPPEEENVPDGSLPFSKSPVVFQGDKVVFSLNAADKSDQSNASTPESSRSSSPEPKPKFLNVSAAVPHDLSPIQSCDEDICSAVLDSEWEKLPKMTSSPIQIPRNNKLTTEQCQEKSSNSAHSSRAGTPTCQTFEFVPPMVPPGMPIVKMDVENSLKKSNKNCLVIKHYETSPIEGCCDPHLGNDFEFNIDEPTRFLNVCVWSHNLSNEVEKVPISASEKGVAATKEVLSKLMKKDSRESISHLERKSSQDMGKTVPTARSMTGHPDNFLVAYANIKVEDILEESSFNSQGNVVKIIDFQPADPNCPEVIDHPLQHNIGFDPRLCYGDVTFSITLKTNKKKLKSKSDKGAPAMEEDSATDATQSDDDENETSSESKGEKYHSFKRTHFNSTTQCNFCQKKIWLKDAYQCSECGIICHKKCMLRCEQTTICDSGGLIFREIKDSNKDIPEIMTPGSSPPKSKETVKSPPHTPQSPRHALGSFLTQISSESLKRTGSAHNLALPLLSSDFGLSRSLPPSPLHRKALPQGNPFICDGDYDKHLEKVLDRLVSHAHEERLVSLARESANLLYTDLPIQPRIEKIKLELETLRLRISRENDTRVDLVNLLKENHDTTKKAKLTKKVSDCDARTQAFGLLTVHFYSALQIAQEVIEKDV